MRFLRSFPQILLRNLTTFKHPLNERRGPQFGLQAWRSTWAHATIGLKVTRLRHFSTCAEYEDLDTGRKVAFTFPEEPLGIPAIHEAGFYQGGPGDRIGHEDRYKLKQKLHYGTLSTSWLARDTLLDRFVMMKIVTGCSTIWYARGRYKDLEAHHCLGAEAAEHNCSILLDYFLIRGVDEADGQHLCLVYDVLQSNLYHVIDKLDGEGKALALPVVKLVMKDILRAVAYLHRKGIAHRCIAPECVSMAVGDSGLDIEKWLEQNLPKTYEPVPSIDYEVTTWESHPFPILPIDQLQERWFVLHTFREAEFVDSPMSPYTGSYPLALRPPEYITVPFIQLYKLLTLKDLFTTQQPPTFGAALVEGLAAVDTEPASPELVRILSASNEPRDSAAYVFYQMAIFCDGFDMSPECLEVFMRMKGYPEADVHALILESRKLDRSGIDPKGGSNRVFEILLEHYGATQTTDEERKSAAAFLARCLRLMPSNRATAEELLEDPWLRDD
ncbi:hypothetical protein AX16_005137 [Volvariella volvacea WC 439]|nr:hypothetical protein AX16_005137 [Volvariella volvacea WC 439]